ncbi:MAG: hypothetical protein LIP01_15300, partial [Tannerellaceae bacterium]|nr:hypothetical protein [Tannerellaceae bacterium]
SEPDMTYAENVLFIKRYTGHGDMGKICKQGGFSRTTLDSAMKQTDFTDLSEREKEALKLAVVYATNKKKQAEENAEAYRQELSNLIGA